MYMWLAIFMIFAGFIVYTFIRFQGAQKEAKKTTTKDKAMGMGRNEYIVPIKDKNIFYVENRDKLLRIHKPFNGMIVYVKEERKIYCLKNGEASILENWIEIDKTI